MHDLGNVSMYKGVLKGIHGFGYKESELQLMRVEVWN